MLADGPRTAWADVDGSFRIDGLPPGDYSIEAALDGFQPSQTEITLVVGQEQEALARFFVDRAMADEVEDVPGASLHGSLQVAPALSFLPDQLYQAVGL